MVVYMVFFQLRWTNLLLKIGAETELKTHLIGLKVLPVTRDLL